MYEYMEKSTPKHKSKSSHLNNKKIETLFPRGPAFVPRGNVVQRVQINLKTAGSGSLIYDSNTSQKQEIKDWIDESIRTQPAEVHNFITQLSASPHEGLDEEILQYAIGQDRERRINALSGSLLEITGDSTNFPYGGFLSEYSPINRQVPDDSPLIESLGMEEVRTKASSKPGIKRFKKPGMNCWGAILFAAFRAGLIDKNQMLELDTKGSDMIPHFLNGPREELCKSWDEWNSYNFIKGCIISVANVNQIFTEDGVQNEILPGKHVFLSMGGSGLDTPIIEFDSRGNRGLAKLQDVFLRHVGSHESITLFIYKPDWLGF